jgi:predicted AAA+ superfamily ATPase
LIKEFVNAIFDDVAFFDLEKDSRLYLVFENDLDPRRILNELGSLRGKPIVPGQTVLVLDEIQKSRRAITSLKYFNQDMPDLAIIVAGSLLGVALSEDDSFPVGKVTLLKLRPMVLGKR